MSNRVLVPPFNPAKQPLFPVRVDWTQRLAGNLACLFIPSQRAAPGTLLDLTGNCTLSVVGTPSIAPGPHGVQAFSGTDAGWQALAPVALQPQNAVTVFWSGDIVGAGALSSNPLLFGVFYNNTGGVPYVGWALVRNSSNQAELAWNIGGTEGTLAQSATLSTGPLTLVGTVAAGGATSLYMSGQSPATGTAASGTIGYGSSPQLAIGKNLTAVGAQVASATAICGMWPRVLSELEIATLFAKSYAMLMPIRRLSFFPSGGSAPPTAAPGVASALGIAAFVPRTLLYAAQLNTAVGVLDGGSTNQSELFVPASGQICNLASGIKWHDIQPKAPLAELTVVLPATAGHGELHSITIGQDIYQLNVLPNANQSLRAAPGQAVADSCLSWRMYGPSSTWRRVS